MSGRKQYAPAPEVADIARRLIAAFHPHLHGVRIEYVWVNKPPVIHGKPRAACMRKVTGLYAFLATPGFAGEPEPFFVMEVCKPIWDHTPAEGRLALVDHELKHGGYDDELDSISIVPHDIEEFDDVVERHGAWHDGLVRFAELLHGARAAISLDGLPLKNNRDQSNAVRKGAKRKSEWKAPQVSGAH